MHKLKIVRPATYSLNLKASQVSCGGPEIWRWVKLSEFADVLRNIFPGYYHAEILCLLSFAELSKDRLELCVMGPDLRPQNLHFSGFGRDNSLVPQVERWLAEGSNVYLPAGFVSDALRVAERFGAAWVEEERCDLRLPTDDPAEHISNPWADGRPEGTVAVRVYDAESYCIVGYRPEGGACATLPWWED